VTVAPRLKKVMLRRFSKGDRANRLGERRRGRNPMKERKYPTILVNYVFGGGVKKDEKGDQNTHRSSYRVFSDKGKVPEGK